MKKKLFSQDQLDSPEHYDLCTTIKGVYLDVMNNKGTWNVLWNNGWVALGLASRADAIKWCEENVSNLKRGDVEYLDY